MSYGKLGLKIYIDPSNLTDKQRALTGSLIPVHPGGRRRKTDPRQVVNAILYIPPKSTVWRSFNNWRHDGTWEKSVLSSEAFVTWAMIPLMLDRLEPKMTDAVFPYRKTA